MTKAHSFHIPVMGIGFSIDTPLKVAQYGMDSVIFLSDDVLLEKLRKMYSGKFQIPYTEIAKKTEDSRAKRITAYLNLINKLARQKFEELKNVTLEKSSELKAYFNMLPDSSLIKQEFNKLTAQQFNLGEIRDWLKNKLSMGSIDVNIMTKLDGANYNKEGQLPIENNNAHAALRGYANSDLRSSIVFSAGMNPRLFGYMEQFEDFFPNEKGEIKKKIVLKVSDYRSALIQGKFLAKKGLWVSEYRVESGLNCGGHTFATDGFLMGPILTEFKEHRKELIQSIHEILVQALKDKNRTVPTEGLALRITAQGGVGTTEEHQFLLDHYEVDSVGWASPFLLVPEVTSVDDITRNMLVEASENELYLSNSSPLGVPFRSLKGNTKDIEKAALVAEGKSGSTCPKRILAFNNEYTERAICTASHQYQKIKIKELEVEKLSPEEHEHRFKKISEPSCLCVGLATAALIVNDVDTKSDGDGVLICPGPNLAYFSKKMSLAEITDHIYGRVNVITRTDRPHMFIKELQLYFDFLKIKIAETQDSITKKQEKYFTTFIKNLDEGIDYYHSLFSDLKEKFTDTKSSILSELDAGKKTLKHLNLNLPKFQKVV